MIKSGEPFLPIDFSFHYYNPKVVLAPGLLRDCLKARESPKSKLCAPKKTVTNIQTMRGES
jgi:hypothetical protein